MMAVISSFRGPYWFLSNFSTCGPIRDDYGIHYPTVEHAYQAAKTDDSDLRVIIAAAPNPAGAKRLGRHVTLREDWREIRVQIMRGFIEQKFRAPALRALLLATGDAELVEGNTWGDKFWGVCNGEGENWLGRLLMEMRAAIRAERP